MCAPSDASGFALIGGGTGARIDGGVAFGGGARGGMENREGFCLVTAFPVGKRKFWVWDIAALPRRWADMGFGLLGFPPPGIGWAEESARAPSVFSFISWKERHSAQTFKEGMIVLVPFPFHLHLPSVAG